MTEAPSRRRARRDDSPADEPTSSALYGPDPLKPVREAVLRRDPDAFVLCFAPDAYLRVPRREGDIVLRGHEELGRASRDLQSMIREFSWTPSRRLVSAAEVTEEAVVVARQHERRPSRVSAPPPVDDEGIRVPLRVVAGFGPDGLISALTLWLDWAALLDPKGLNSADGLASALVALARARDDRGFRVLQTPPVPVIPEQPAATEQEEPDRPKPMSRGAVWWQVHRNTVVGSVMALAALVLLGWVGLHVLPPLKSSDPSTTAVGDLRGADATDTGQTGNARGPGSGDGANPSSALSDPGSTDPGGTDPNGTAPGGTDPGGTDPGGTGQGGTALGGSNAGSSDGEGSDAANSDVGGEPGAEGEPGAGAGGESGAGDTSSASDPQATGAGPGGSGAPVLSSQKPNVAPTVQPGREITFLSDVLFPFNSFELSPRASSRLDNLARQVREARMQGTIQVNGYTDSTGSETHNLDLSQQRALAVANALSLRLHGTNVRLDVQGFGETSPRRTNDTKAGRRANRRVTVVLPEQR
ncbi:hypothetical protein Kisp01_30930 [Kineosporia sp. NBRC 101677]|uniref:OmpA family protein n=1 Tax=Kineosporia sp. NBRC 101677 TaxID=3032197 RepID=UPI0024A4BF8B|nr:OmpA family protein [Kineosporia sp. NBRC 101677]GLY16078.1 hypothetical protein Kisp01_30930 [Kineosporia sp. NBRC 101677]